VWSDCSCVRLPIIRNALTLPVTASQVTVGVRTVTSAYRQLTFICTVVCQNVGSESLSAILSEIVYYTVRSRSHTHTHAQTSQSKYQFLRQFLPTREGFWASWVTISSYLKIVQRFSLSELAFCSADDGHQWPWSGVDWGGVSGGSLELMNVLDVPLQVLVNYLECCLQIILLSVVFFPYA
jgi:hypothetical protein